MSANVDTRTVEMRFDNSNFEQNARQSMSTLEKLKHALKLDGASAGLKEIEKESRKLDFKDYKDNIDSVGKRFNILETIATGALLKIGASAAEAGMRLAKSLTVDQLAAGWSKYADKTTSVQTIMANLREDEAAFVSEAEKLEYVNTYLNKLLWFSDETSYSFTDMTSNVGKFIANGQGLKESVTAMQGIAAWAAVSGQNTQVAARAMYNISQAMGTGAMKIKDWMSIENANMATAQFKELAITIGQKQGKIQEGQVTIENFRESLSGQGTKDWFDKDVMMEVFETYGEAANRIQEYAEEHSVTSTKAIQKIKETDKEFADSIGFKAFAAAQEAKTFGEVVSATADAVSTKWMKIFENIFGDYLQAKELWTDLSEQMWEIFAQPLDTLNDIMSLWNKGFLAKSPQNIIETWFSSGKLDDLDNGLSWITEDIAKMAVASDKAKYKIETLADGTKRLVKTIDDGKGHFKTFYKNIYNPDDSLVSGRDNLLTAFQNIFDTVIHDVYDKNDKLEHMSFFGALKRGLQEVVFGTSDVDKIIPIAAKKIWDLTNRFTELTEKLKPSMETSLKIKNAFKGLFTIFKTGVKILKAIIKPFADLFGNVFKNAPKGILDLSNSISDWIQNLDKFLEENNVFDSISKFIENGLNRMTDAANSFSVAITGLSLEELLGELKGKLSGFFDNFDFKNTYDRITSFFSGLKDEISQVESGNLPETLTPFQKFLTRWSKIKDGLNSFFYAKDEAGNKLALVNILEQIRQVKSGDLPEYLSPFQAFLITAKNVIENLRLVFGKIVELVNQIRQVKTGDLPETLTPFQKFALKGKNIFTRIKNFFGSIWPIISKMALNIVTALKTKDYKALFSSILDTLVGLYAKVKNSGFVKFVINTLRTIFGSVFDFVSYLASSLSSGTASGVFKAIGLVIGLVTIVNLLNSVIAVWGFSRGVKGVFDGIYQVCQELSEFFHSKAIEAKGNAAKSFAAAVLMLTVAVAALGNLDVKTIAQGLVAIGLLVGVIWLFKKVTDESKTFVAASLALLAFSVAIIILSAIAVILGSIDSKKVYGGIVSIALMTLVFGLFAKLVKKASGINLVLATASFAIFAVAVGILSIGVRALGTLSLGDLAKGVIAVGLLTAIFGLFKVLTKSIVGVNLILATASFAIFAIAIGILSIGVKALGALSLGDLAKGVIAVGVLTVIFGLFKILTKTLVGVNLVLAAAAFTIFAIAVDALSIGVKILGTLSLGDLAKGVIAVGLLVVIFGLFRVLMTAVIGVNFIIITAAFILFAAAIDAISIGVKSLGTLSLGDLAKGVIAVGLLVVIFGLFRVLMTAVIGVNFIIVTAAFVAFSIAIDIVAIGVKTLGTLSLGDLAKGLIAVGLLVAMFALLVHIPVISFSSIGGFLAFAAAILVVSLSLRMLIPVMQEIDSMGDGWWKPLVFLAGAIALLLAAGAISGLAPVAIGLLVLSGAVLAIGAACMLAGVGIGAAALGLAFLTEAIATYGPQAAENLHIVINAILDTIINSAPKLAVAGQVLITSLAIGIGNSAGAIVSAAVVVLVQFARSFLDTILSLIPTLVQGFITAINVLAYTIRASAPLIVSAGQNLMEALIEAILVGIAGLVEPFGGIGKRIAKKITDWIPSLRGAFNVLEDESENAGEDAADAYLSGAEHGSKYGVEYPTAKPSSNASSAGSEVGRMDAEAYTSAYNQAAKETADNAELDLEALLTKYGIGSGELKTSGQSIDFSSLLPEIPGVENGVADFSKLLNVESLDMSGFSSMLTEGFGGIDFSLFGNDMMSNLAESMTSDANKIKVSESSKAVADEIEKPVKDLNSYAWGTDIGDGLGDGILDSIPYVVSCAKAMAAAIRDYLGFSEPEKGPLSDFHTYAPDMIKLWNKGVYGNLSSIDDSSKAMSDTIYDGFSSALDYVSDLIDNGMSDQLTIRPVMDLSEIQNGVNSMNGMLSTPPTYTVMGTSRLAAAAAYGMGAMNSVATDPQASITDVGPTTNNFYISGADPDAIADRISKLLAQQTRRQKATWAKNK